MALRTAYPDANIRAFYAMGSASVFLPIVSLFFPNCAEFNRIRLQAALDAPADDFVFHAQELSDWRKDAVLETVKRLRDAGKSVYLPVEFRGTMKNTPIEIGIEALRFPESANHLERYIVEDPLALDGEYAAQIKTLGAVYTSNREFFYDGEYHFTDRETGKFLTLDGKYLNEFGARKYGKFLRENHPLQLRF